MSKEKGYVSFVLHAHLPFVHHPESEDYLEEQWLYEAMSETYIPLLTNFKKLEEEKVDFRITMSLTPPLLNMLDNKMLQERYIKYLNTHIELAKKEVERTKYDDRLNNLAKYYVDKYSSDLHVFKDIYNCNLIKGFKHFQDIGVLEIITCGATHGYFPILYVNEKTVKAQIAIGVQTYEKYLLNQTNFDLTLTEERRVQAKLAVKDEYTFDFAELSPEYSEHELEMQLVNNIRSFLIEMGGDFTFIGNQYHLMIGSRDLYIDLLLFHRRLRSLIAIELKIGEFEAEYAGKMQMYLTALDEQVKLPDENPSIGIIICKSKDKMYVEYALKQINAPIGVATYQLRNTLPEEMKAMLPEPEEIVKRLRIFEKE